MHQKMGRPALGRPGAAHRQFAILKVKMNLRKHCMRVTIAVSPFAERHAVVFLIPALQLQAAIRMGLYSQWGSLSRGDGPLLGLHDGFTVIEPHAQVSTTGGRTVVLRNDLDRMAVRKGTGPGRQSDRRPNEDTYHGEKLACTHRKLPPPV